MQYRVLRIILSIITAIAVIFAIVVAMSVLLFSAMEENVPSPYVFLLLVVVLAAATFIISYIATGIFLGPLSQLVNKVQQLAQGQLSVRFMDDDLEHTPLDVQEFARALDTVGTRVRASMAEASAESKRQRQFVSDVAHELRTPLTAIRGAAETMLDDDLPAEIHDRFATTIIRESERLSRLANDLLTLQHIEGDGEITLKRVNLHTVIEHAVDLLSPLLVERNIELTLGGEAPDVLGDPDRLQQVLSNLIDNASRYADEGGTIHVELSGIHEHSVVTVADNGPGFGDIDPARLFDRFYRGDFSRARNSGGAGLGLTIVKAIITAHDGTVEAINLPSGGACFIVAIPSLPPTSSA
jgi:two-component system OmpR family sensor kinase